MMDRIELFLTVIRVHRRLSFHTYVPSSVRVSFHTHSKTTGLSQHTTMSEDTHSTTVATVAPVEEAPLSWDPSSHGPFRLYLGDEKQNLDCRFYEDKYPAFESLVMVNVRNVADMGAYVSLLEYNNIEGMIPLSELSRRRIRSINKLIRVGRNEVVTVLRVDHEKGYIDLSKRRVSPEDVIACEDRFNKARAVHGVLRHLAERKNYYLEELYVRIGWPLYRKYGHAYDAFKLAMQEGVGETGKEEDPFADLTIPQEIKDDLKLYIRRRLAPQPIKIRADIEVSCFTYEGIDAIQQALLAGMACGGEENNSNTIKIKLIAPPIYVLSTMTLEKEVGIALLNTAIDTIQKNIVEKGGKLDVKMAAKAVSVKEETELQAMMDRLAMENEEVDGDAPEE
jgi:translation initiation factor 2 subunit 1